jgi:hypothetical protein
VRRATWLTILIMIGVGVTGCGHADPVVRTIGRPAGGTTVHLALNDELVVRLTGSSWTFGPLSRPGILRPLGAPRNVGCRPEFGCRSTTASYRASETGTVVVSASRSSCGEALRCIGAEGSFRVTVVIG